MSPDDRHQVAAFAAEHPDTLIAKTWRELERLELMLEAAYERNPSFDKFRQIKQWASSYTVRAES